MKPRGRTPKPLHGRGEVRGDALYPVTVLMRRLGIARNSLQSLRRRGLAVHTIGRRCAVVDGAELLRFLRAEWQVNPDQGSNDPSASAQNHGGSKATVPGDGTQGGPKS